MKTHTEFVRVIATKYDAGDTFALSHEPEPNIFWYLNGKVTTNLESLKDASGKFVADIYQFYVKPLEHSWDCQLIYEIKNRGIEDSFGFDADAFTQAFDEKAAKEGGYYQELLMAYSVTVSTQYSNYGKDVNIEYSLVGEVDISRLPLTIAPSVDNPRPKVVCLCGSTRFSQAYQDANLSETLQGNIVLTIGADMKSDNALFADKSPDELAKIKTMLDDHHKRKIDMADEILVLNVDGYIGSSTASEIEYAQAQGKGIRYLEPVAASITS